MGSGAGEFAARAEGRRQPGLAATLAQHAGRLLSLAPLQVSVTPLRALAPLAAVHDGAPFPPSTPVLVSESVLTMLRFNRAHLTPTAEYA